MNRVEHPTEEQIFAYAADSLERSRVAEIGSHLLACADCRELMPVPTPQQFRAAFLGETNHSEQYHSFEKSLPTKTWLISVWSLIDGRRLVWSAGALILVAGFSLLIWRASIKSTESSDLARTMVIESNGNETPIDENPQSPSDEHILKNKEAESPTLPAHTSKKLKNSASSVTEQSDGKLNRIEDIELARIIENTLEAVLSLRPKSTAVLRNNPDDSEPKGVFSLIGPVGETVLGTAPDFRWEKATGAKSYKITIFDAEFNEVLTATISDNRFKPDKTLTPGAKYLWRVAAQTADGEVIAPHLPQPPAMFQIASEKAETRIQSLKKSDDQFKLALFYAREGILDPARCTLEKILLQNSQHRSAKRLLVKVVQWQKANNTIVRRCGVEPSAETRQQSDEINENFRQ